MNESYIHREGVTNDPLRRLELSRRLTELTNYQNSALAGLAARMQLAHPESAFAIFETHRFFKSLIAVSGEGTEFEAVGDAAQSRHIPGHSYTGSYMGSRNADAVCESPSTRLFWDRVHPTTRVHCQLAAGITDRMAQLQWLDAAATLSRCE